MPANLPSSTASSANSYPSSPLKPQTTRSRILGILTRPNSQMIFLDTPGLLTPTYKLHRAMGRQIDMAVRDADVVLLLIDATRPKDRRQLIDPVPAQ